MTSSVTKGLPALLGDARNALGMNQEQLAEVMESSKRTVQRWETKRGLPYPANLVRLVARVFPLNPALAAELASHAGQTLEGLGLVAPPPVVAQPVVPQAPPEPPQPPAPPAMPRHLAVDAVVCVASEALGQMPGAVRGALLAAFRRARELGLSYDEVEQALEAALRPADPK